MCGGPYLYLAAAFAYLADFRQRQQRARTFAILDGLLLFIASFGPLVAALLVAKIGYWGMFSTCSAVYALAASAFLLAPPSPQRPAAQPSDNQCREWALTSTPVLLWRMLRTRQLNVVCLAFALSLSGTQAGAITMVCNRHIAHCRHERPASCVRPAPHCSSFSL